ncbi:MAG TPA: pyruvate dehydrogenase (acetyl-transferring), homodimeric type [Candidatus Lambdaproteobacteria bacterium]|nr:pyruvate dehydrogenase (acetyl-transferring), homodimeric type [Candidatus Lambdaproteobacteria bacterium]HIO60709.1 pyruvate dehydrogenase (acetyl-transferring), homodimeric type [Deltaproteobacteria bacterium]
MTSKKVNDLDPQETQEWVEAMEAVVERDGHERAQFLLRQLADQAVLSGAGSPYSVNTPYLNTIPPELEVRSQGDQEMESKIRSIIRWNAAIMVMRANRDSADLGGHIASFASSATLYDIGFNHFWRAPGKDHGGDLIFFQGHSAPGIYARAFLEGRLTEKQMDNFRRESEGEGVPSYPHPWLMNEFWQFPTVSMGLGPIMAIYQARFLKYIHNRGIADTSERKVWMFLGDGETDEPQSLGAIGLAAREKLDNLIFVINCNLQRLDGPVRGNGKIIQELEGEFRGAGWNVIKVIWGSYWDPLLARDTEGLLRKRMDDAIDGEYQAFKAKGGAYTRAHFFGKYPELLEMVSNMSDEDIWRLNRGGHDPHKIYAAYHSAVNHSDQPTVILAKTVKGYGMGGSGEAINITHSQKKMKMEDLRSFRDRFRVPISDDEVEQMTFYRPPDDAPEVAYLKKCRKALGGNLPVRRLKGDSLTIPPLSVFERLLQDTGDREISTTQALVQAMTLLCRDKNIGQRLVPIVPDEARTFGMEGMFRQIGIYAHEGQKYEPVDRDQLMYYKENQSGQLLEEGITEDGAMSSWIASATSYTNSGLQMIPFYIFYSMFGFQRVGDLIWAAGDMQARGFLIGATSGRTTLNGEGLQHEDGHSQIMAGNLPNCVSYDPTFSYELMVILQDGMQRMFKKQENVFYYITTMNENYSHPGLSKGQEKDIIKGMYLFQKAKKGKTKVQLLGSGSILREVIAAADLLKKEFKVQADIWSCPSFNELKRDGDEVSRWNLLHPDKKPRKCHVTQCLENTEGPVVAATDYVKLFADQIRAYVPKSYTVLGTDGFGRSDSREALRKHFEVDRYFITVAVLNALVGEDVISVKTVKAAIKKYGIDTEKNNPLMS